MLRAPAAPLVALLGLVCAVSCTQLPTIEAAPVDGGGVDAGALPDANALDGSSEPSGCQVPTVPEAVCNGSICPRYAVSTVLSAGNVALVYPHGLALSGKWLYFAVQEATGQEPTDGRNFKGRGAIFRVDRQLRDGAVPVAVSGLQERPRAITAGFGAVYWAAADPKSADKTVIYRLDDTVECGLMTCPPPEVIATVSQPVTTLVVSSADRVLAMTDTLISIQKKPSGWLSAPVAVTTGGGKLAGLNGGVAFYASGLNVEAIRADGAVVSYATGVAKFNDLDVAAACTEAAAFSTNSGVAFARSGSTLAPIQCTGQCPGATTATVTYDGALDAGFLYLAAPDAGGLFRLPRGGGERIKLIDGDFWDVAVDNDNVYGTDINGKRLVRILKRTP